MELARASRERERERGHGATEITGRGIIARKKHDDARETISGREKVSAALRTIRVAN